MNMKKLNLLIAAITLACASTAHAQSFTGGIAVAATGLTNSPAYTYDSSSGAVTLTLASTGIFEEGDGTFLPIAFGGSVPTTNYEIDGLTLGQTLVLSTPVVFELTTTFVGAGTTPADEFAFDITSLKVTSIVPLSGPVFSGTGIFVDNTDVLTPTAATFTADYSGSNNYSFSASVATPEPSAWAMAFVCVALFVCIRLRLRS
jgi:hypothetical protein